MGVNRQTYDLFEQIESLKKDESLSKSNTDPTILKIRTLQDTEVAHILADLA